MAKIIDYLISQSAHPTGNVGKLFMLIWNQAYKNLYLFGMQSEFTIPTNNILDIGCGNGLSSWLLAQHFLDSKVMGIDISKTAITTAKKKYAKVSNLAFTIKDITEMNDSPEKYELITAFQTHFHWQNIEITLTKILPLLSPNGRLIIACEENKLAHHLPKYQASEDFVKLLSQIGFVHITVERRNGFIKYSANK